MTKDKLYPLSIHQFKYLSGEKYRPNIPEKIIIENGLYYLNTAIPTNFMMLDGEPDNKPEVILDFLFNLLDKKFKHLQFFLQWLAFNFIYGIKPQTAVVLFGLEGVGKNILYYIIERLYGEDACSQVNAESLKSNYKLTRLIKEKRLINFDEVTANVSKRYESLFKAVITNPHIELNKKVELHAQCLFTANYATVFNIKKGDRRYSVFQTGQKLSENNFLGFGNYDNLKAYIDLELEDFAKYLKTLEIDFELLQEPFETPEKERIIGLANVYLQEFHDALVNLRIEYFHKLRNRDLLLKMSKDFKRYFRINRTHVALAFNDLFGDDISTDTIMEQLRVITTEDIFEVKNIKHSGSNWYIYPRGKDNSYF